MPIAPSQATVGPLSAGAASGGLLLPNNPALYGLTISSRWLGSCIDATRGDRVAGRQLLSTTISAT